MKKFYKERIKIKFCRAPECRVRFSRDDHLGYCHVHRKEYYAKWWASDGKKYYESLTPEQKAKYKVSRYRCWVDWTIKNRERRRKLALDSYHRNKEKHREVRNKKRRERYKKLQTKA